MPFRLLYLLLGCIYLAAALAVYVKRPDLRRAIVVMGCVGGFLEAISEVWYLKDYWRPITVVPGWPAPEDFIYGFGVTALTVCVVPVLARCNYVPAIPNGDRPLKKIATAYVAILISVAFAVMMSLTVDLVDLPSIWMATLCFFAFGLGVLLYRENRQFILQGLLCGIFMGLLSLGGYAVGLNFVVDGDAFLREVLITYNTKWDMRVAGNVPLDEVAWNTARGWCFGLLYPALTWQRFALR